jgi:opacity protein-like surface antigen
MKKLFLLTALAGVFTFSTVKAQDPAMSGAKLGIGAEFAFPMGNFGDIADLGYGASLTYIHPLGSALKVTGSAGYTRFDYKEDVLGYSLKSEHIPLKAGLRYYVAENFFLGGELGASIPTVKNSKTSFAYAPGLGVEFPVADKGAVELGARYEAWSANSNTSGFIGLRLAYNFGL